MARADHHAPRQIFYLSDATEKLTRCLIQMMLYECDVVHPEDVKQQEACVLLQKTTDRMRILDISYKILIRAVRIRT